MKKIVTLIFTFVFILTSVISSSASANENIFKDVPYVVYSNEIPKSVVQYANEQFQVMLEQPRQAPDEFGIEKTHLDYMYLGQGFNIFEKITDKLTTNNIYYYPIMYDNRIEAIFTIGLNSDGSCFSTLGLSFAKELQAVFEKYNDNTPFILISSDVNIYIQNKKYIDQNFKNKTSLDLKAKFKTKERDTNATYKEIGGYSPNLTANAAAATSTWLQVPIVNQRDQSGTQRGMCWAACAACVLNYKQGRSLTAYNICDLMRTGYDSGGTPSQESIAMQYYGVTTSKVLTSILSTASIESYINNNTPIIMNSWTGDNQYAHATAIRGYMVGSNYIQLSMMNPATERYESASANSGTYSFVMGNMTYYWRQTVTYN